jgi:hypothetical protein
VSVDAPRSRAVPCATPIASRERPFARVLRRTPQTVSARGRHRRSFAQRRACSPPPPRLAQGRRRAERRRRESQLGAWSVSVRACAAATGAAWSIPGAPRTVRTSKSAAPTTIGRQPRAAALEHASWAAREPAGSARTSG